MNAVAEGATPTGVVRPLGTLIAAALCVGLGLVQVLLGDELPTATMFAGATFFGYLAIRCAGLRSPMGLLNFLLLARYLLGAYAAKNLFMGEGIAARLHAPETTAAVMFLGFGATWLGTMVGMKFARPLPLFREAPTTQGLLILTVILVLAGNGAAVLVRLSGVQGVELNGGAWGLVKTLLPFANLAIPTYMMYLWQTRSERWLLHPALLILVCLSMIIGIFNTGKQAMAEPLAFYLIMGILRYGFRRPALWVFLGAGLVVFQSFVFPVSQYARSAGGRDLKFGDAIATTTETVVSFLTDARFRLYVEEVAQDSVQTTPRPYLDPKFSAFQRMAMIGEADRLLAATDFYKNFTGWDTISDAILFSIPSFLYPAKPLMATNNFLGHYAGDAAPEDFGTQFSYGFFANWYNAFGLPGVLAGSAITVVWIGMLIGLIATGKPQSDPWYLLAVVGLNQSYVEQSMSGQIWAIHIPLIATILLLSVRILERVLFVRAGQNMPTGALR